MSEPNELWLKHRPTNLDDVVGQESAVSIIRTFLKSDKVPHAILFTGNSGIGKSTLAHILANELGCNTSGGDRKTVNCATIDNPLEAIKELDREVRLSPSGSSRNRVWILEEIQSLTRSNYARQAILLMLESTSKATRKSYLIACTTEPQKLKTPILNRFKKIELNPLSDRDMKTLLSRIAVKEEKEVSDKVLNQIIEVSGGSAREAVNQLDTALNAGIDEESMLAVISGVKESSVVYKLFQALFWKKPEWSAVVDIIKEVNEDAEVFRHIVLKRAATEMMKGGKEAWRAHLIHECFRSTWEYCKESGLVGSCWEVVRDIKNNLERK